ncbi:MAG TPA: wax ester/triacylglycerol synthase family O-acyltransferase [Kineosporiaceae bacterium]|nr:wax ester/triacylglycerol synthase family O-acyltransferase [Kineosporiaceae bacterium]
MTGNRPIGAVDTMWLNMDRPNNLMVIDSIMWFDGPVAWDRLVPVIEHRLLDRYPVFRQRPVASLSPIGMPHWQDDPDFSLSRHLHRVVLPPPGDDAELQRYVETQLHLPFDREHPLWEFHLIDGYRGGSAVYTRFHHALADGIALSQVLLSLTDDGPKAQVDDESAGSFRAPVQRHGRVVGAASRVTGTATSALLGALHLFSELPHQADPARLIDALSLTQQTGHIVNKLLLGSNPSTPLGGTPGIAKRVVWSQARRLSEVKRLGRMAGATVNDVLVGAVSAAVSAYLFDHGGEAVDLTTMVPMNLRPPGQPLPRELGNHFALVLLKLPTGVWAPLQRLSETKRRMDSIKDSPEAVLTFGLINAIGHTSPEIERFLVDFFSAKAFGVTTNVAGPPTQRFVAGTAIAGLLGWVPGSGKQTVGVSILTYNQTVRVGFKVDAAIVPDPEKLVGAFDEAIDDYLRLGAVA